jgi:hypothetical protein
MLTLVAGIAVQVVMLVVLVRWAMRKDRRLRAREDMETADGGVAHAVQHRR